MPPTYANIIPAAHPDGVPYATAVPLTSTEADLFNQVSPPFVSPPEALYNHSIVATVTLTTSGAPTSNTSYVVLQHKMPDGNWIDLAGVRATNLLGTTIFTLAAGAPVANAVEQSRAVGTAPGSNFANQLPLGGQIRFVGKATTEGSASSNPGPGGVTAQVTATIYYKMIAPR